MKLAEREELERLLIEIDKAWANAILEGLEYGDVGSVQEGAELSLGARRAILELFDGMVPLSEVRRLMQLSAGMRTDHTQGDVEFNITQILSEEGYPPKEGD